MTIELRQHNRITRIFSLRVISRAFSIVFSVTATFFLLTMPAQAYAMTEVTEPITADATWTKEGSPYVIRYGFGVDSGATLAIGPGVIVKFEPPSFFLIEGRIEAVGTEAEPIHFTSLSNDEIGGDTNGDGDGTQPSPYDWSLYFSGIEASSSPESVFSHVTMSFVERIWLNRTVLAIDHAELSQSISGFQLGQSRALLSDISMHDIKMEAISLAEQSELDIIRATIVLTENERDAIRVVDRYC